MTLGEVRPDLNPAMAWYERAIRDSELYRMAKRWKGPLLEIMICYTIATFLVTYKSLETHPSCIDTALGVVKYLLEKLLVSPIMVDGVYSVLKGCSLLMFELL